MIRSNKRFSAIVLVGLLVAALVAPQAALATTTIKLDGSTTVQPLAQQWSAAYHKLHPTVNVIVAGGGSGVGWKDCNNGVVDIGMSSRGKVSGDPNLTMTRVARDGVCVVVSPYVGGWVKKLTSAQIKAIFTGGYTNWKAVGGPNATIVLAGRTGASGTYAYFKSEFLGGAKQSARTKQYASNGMVRSAVAGNKWAIGYVSVAYVNSTVKAPLIDGVAPTHANCASGAYKHVRPLYFLTKGTMSAAVKAFINYCISSAGQAIAVKNYEHR